MTDEKKVRCIKFSCELHDGVSSIIIHARELRIPEFCGVLDSMVVFLEAADIGDTFTGELVEMTETEFKGLPDV